MNQVLTNINEIFEQGNLHMKDKLKYFGGQGQVVVKYIINRLRKYSGEFFESNSTVSENTSVSVRTVQNTVKRMIELEIIVVSSRKESTLNGKMRQTSNVIRLLPYKTVEVVKEVVETVRQVVKKVVEKVERVAEKVSEVMKPQQVRKPYTKKPVRVEVVPSWLNVEYVKAEETAEVKRQREELQLLLKGMRK